MMRTDDEDEDDGEQSGAVFFVGFVVIEVVVAGDDEDGNDENELRCTCLSDTSRTRAARRARRAIMGDDYTGDDMDELLGEDMLDEGAEFKKMVLDDLMDLTESMPALSTAVKDGTDLAEEFLKTLRTKIKGHDEA